jgi:hypothetical protein
MGIHTPPPKKRWIICTKFIFKSEEGEAISECWVPIGQHDTYTTTGKRRGRVFDYESLEEVQAAFNDIIDLKEPFTSNLKDLTYCACEVRYIPGKIRPYSKEWHHMQVSKEVELKINKPMRGSQEDLNP